MADPGGSTIVWNRTHRILAISAQRSLRSAILRLLHDPADWVVVVRTLPGSRDVFYYAFRGEEMHRLAADHPERLDWTIELAMDMHEWMSSGTARGGRPTGSEAGQSGPAAARVVDFDASGSIVAIGEWVVTTPPVRARSEAVRAPTDLVRPEPDRPRERSLGGDEAKPSPGVEVVVSASTRSEVAVGSRERVRFRVELADGATPLAVSHRAAAKPDIPIVVGLSIENDAIRIVTEPEHTLAFPAAGAPRVGFFVVEGVREGVSRLAVTFRQGGSDLCVVGLAVEVVASGVQAAPTPAPATVAPAPRDPLDDDKLALLVEQRADGGQMFYEYILHSEGLGLTYRRLRSKPLLDRGGGIAGTTVAYVERIYESVTRELRSWDDLKQLEREARALGANLCQELFDPDVAKILWPLRDRIRTVQVVSWEPYIPWELVRLRDPASGDIDDRFLAEYGLVRTLADDNPPRTIPMREWSYLGATFPLGTFPPVGAELAYFTGARPDSLRAHGIMPTAIDATRDALYDTLASGNFDVLHLSCHAQSPQQSIDRASLIIGDETPSGSTQSRLIEVDTITVGAEARLQGRRPLVFLNACETGRTGAVLTAWGGWPNVFVRAGAGAFVGSSWAVRDKPAAAFSTAFYNALLTDETLAEAATTARAAARALGDVSWLAFKVYGHPRARRAI